MDKFEKFLDSTYGRIKEGIRIGKPKLSKIYPVEIKLPFGMLTRHGLIAGTTGTGKSRAAQLMAEQLSEAGVPVIFSDVKGDVSAFNTPGDPSRISERAKLLGIRYSPKSYPAAYFSISERFVPLRINLSEFGAILLSKLMDLNSTQESLLRCTRRKRQDPIGRPRSGLRRLLSADCPCISPSFHPAPPAP
jgi:DNA helicase HerA-like ATPase